MHVIALESYPSALRGGQELNLLDICCGLSERGHSISLLYVNEGNLLSKYQEICDRIIKVDGFFLDRKTMFRFLNFLIDIWKIPVSRDSVVFTNRYHDVLFGSALALTKKIPHVCFLQLPPPEKGFPRPLATGLRGVKYFVAVSHQTQLDWVNSGTAKQKIDVVHGGVNLERYKPASDFSSIRKEWDIPADTRVVSFVGRLDREKGVETLIKAFALLQKNIANTKLLIAGKSVNQGEEYKRALAQLVVDLGIEKLVDFLGHFTNTTSIYQVSDVSVLPSIWSEPFPRAIIESMACATPVIASRIGGIPEFLTGEFHTHLFEPGDERDLANAISQILRWRDTNPRLGEKCYQYVKSKFAIEHMVDGVEKVLLKVIY